WGSNARETHPIFFHHLLRGVRNGARLYAVDPRRTSSAEWADVWLGLDVGSDIALANAVGREIIANGLEDKAFIARATSDFEAYKAKVESYTLDYAEQETGIPADAIREMAHSFAKADKAMICWTLGITEHHNAVDNVLALINLVLLTGHVGRYGSGVNPLRGQNNVQGGGDMGALPDRLPGFQHVENDELRAKFDAAWGVTVPPKRGWHLSGMFEAMERGDLTVVYCIGENPVQSEADQKKAIDLLEGLELLVVQDIFLTATAELADVVLPASAAWAEAEGTVTNSERRVQRVRKALEPPGEARDDLWIIAELARRMGADFGWQTAEDAWNEVRSLSPVHAGMSYKRLEELGGLQWPCYDENHPGELFLHSRLWEDPVPGNRVPFVAVDHDPPVDKLTDDYPIRLTTGRRLDSYNTGVQTGGYTSPLRRGESLDISPEDAERFGLATGELVRVISRRGQVDVPIRLDESLRPGLTFMTLHFQDDVATNLLTIDATDPKSGTAEFKATAIRIEKLEPSPPPDAVGRRSARPPRVKLERGPSGEPSRCPVGQGAKVRTRRARAPVPAGGIARRDAQSSGPDRGSLPARDQAEASPDDRPRAAWVSADPQAHPEDPVREWRAGAHHDAVPLRR
ncbi:MAG TPA: molybdopterin-dependent oxidoreductase, partial [Candidatus Dormibacteraeota bacterium]|nr:molybdopterin-dependent oxidoreductase [Candidatus Dormibacteraeota bacterium]